MLFYKFVKNKFKVVKKRLKTLKKKKFLQNLFYDLMILSLSLSKLQQKSMKGFYHISSNGLERNDIFRSREDFIRGLLWRHTSMAELSPDRLTWMKWASESVVVFWNQNLQCRVITASTKMELSSQSAMWMSKGLKVYSNIRQDSWICFPGRLKVMWKSNSV